MELLKLVELVDTQVGGDCDRCSIHWSVLGGNGKGWCVGFLKEVYGIAPADVVQFCCIDTPEGHDDVNYNIEDMLKRKIVIMTIGEAIMLSRHLNFIGEEGVYFLETVIGYKELEDSV